MYSHGQTLRLKPCTMDPLAWDVEVSELVNWPETETFVKVWHFEDYITAQRELSCLYKYAALAYPDGC